MTLFEIKIETDAPEKYSVLVEGATLELATAAAVQAVQLKKADATVEATKGQLVKRQMIVIQSGQKPIYLGVD